MIFATAANPGIRRRAFTLHLSVTTGRSPHFTSKLVITAPEVFRLPIPEYETS